MYTLHSPAKKHCQRRISLTVFLHLRGVEVERRTQAERHGYRTVCAFAALVRFEPDIRGQETAARAHARVSTHVLSIVSHTIFPLRLLGQTICNDGSTAENVTCPSCTGMPQGWDAQQPIRPHGSLH